MLIHKTTIGFVVQTFDTDNQRYIQQSFIAGDDVQYEQDVGTMNVPIDDPDIPTMNLEMKQPRELNAEQKLIEIQEVIDGCKFGVEEIPVVIGEILDTNC